MSYHEIPPYVIGGDHKLSKIEEKYCSCLMHVRPKTGNPYGICTKSVYGNKKRDKVVDCEVYYDYNKYNTDELNAFSKEKHIDNKMSRKSMISKLNKIQNNLLKGGEYISIFQLICNTISIQDDKKPDDPNEGFDIFTDVTRLDHKFESNSESKETIKKYIPKIVDKKNIHYPNLIKYVNNPDNMVDSLYGIMAAMTSHIMIWLYMITLSKEGIIDKKWYKENDDEPIGHYTYQMVNKYLGTQCIKNKIAPIDCSKFINTIKVSVNDILLFEKNLKK
jgi:hypothetical protein